MSEKISYNSSSDSIAKAIGEEFPKAIRWHTKHEAKREWRDDYKNVYQTISLGLEDEMNCKPVYYSAASGNQWLVVTILTSKLRNDKMHPISQCRTACIYGFTEGYMWAIIACTQEMHDSGANSACVFSPHFFMRFSQRVGFVVRDKMQVLLNFLRVSNYMHYDFVKLEGESRLSPKKKVIGRIDGCMFYGTTDEWKIIRFHTVIPDSQLCIGKQRQTSDFRKNVAIEVSGIREKIYDDALETERPREWYSKQAKANQFSREMIESDMKCLAATIITRVTFFRYCEKGNVFIRIKYNEAMKYLNQIQEIMERPKHEYHFADYEPTLREMLYMVIPNSVPVFIEETILSLREQCADTSVPFDDLYTDLQRKSALTRKQSKKTFKI